MRGPHIDFKSIRKTKTWDRGFSQTLTTSHFKWAPMLFSSNNLQEDHSPQRSPVEIKEVIKEEEIKTRTKSVAEINLLNIPFK